MVRARTDPRLDVPPLPPLHVARPRLLSRLGAAPDVPLTLLSAGPGAGKTVLLSDWVRRLDGVAAWMTVTPSENKPTRFWRLFVSALRACGVSIDDLPPSAIGEGPAGLLESLFLDIAAPAAPLVLVIDEAQLLTDAQILGGLDSIVRGWCPQLRLVLAARSDPLLPLHRYRLAGLMRELRAADLAMTVDETRELLAAHGLTLPADALDVLACRTEGWVAGVRLSALRMKGADRPADFVAELALDEGSIGEYLIGEVLSQQPPTVRERLVQTGFLDEVTGPLADAVTGLRGSAEILVELARSNSFVIPLDAAQTRFRYHRLFAEVLHHILRRQTPQLVATFYGRAAAWYEADGDLHKALRWATAAGDGPYLARLLARGALARAFVDHHDLPEPAALLALLERTDGSEDPDERRVARHVALVFLAERDTATRYAEELRLDRRPEDAELAVTADLAGLILAEKSGDGSAVETMADRLLDVAARRWLDAVPGLRAAVLLARARARFWTGRFDDVDELLEQAREAAVTEHAPTVELDVLGMIALVNTSRVRPGRADAAARQAHALQQSDANLGPSLTLDLATAWRAFITGDVAAMTRAVRSAGASGGEWNAGATVMLVIVRALSLFLRGQASEARLVLDTIATGDDGVPLALAAYRDMMFATIETTLGRPHRALRLLHAYRNTPFAVPVEVVCARAHMRLGELDEAHDCIRHVLTGESSRLGRYLLVEALVCDAEIAHAQGDPGRAVELLVRATEIAEDDISFPFLRTSDVFAPLLQRHVTLAGRWPSATRVTFDGAGDIGMPHESPFPESLTERERAVLRLLATSMTTGEIAEELCVSVNTVKTHLAAVYRKLGARRRREAVVRAREYEVL